MAREARWRAKATKSDPKFLQLLAENARLAAENAALAKAAKSATEECKRVKQARGVRARTGVALRYACEHGCGLVGGFDTVAEHERGCALRRGRGRRRQAAEAAAATGRQGHPGAENLAAKKRCEDCGQGTPGFGLAGGKKRWCAWGCIRLSLSKNGS